MWLNASRETSWSCGKIQQSDLLRFWAKLNWLVYNSFVHEGVSWCIASVSAFLDMAESHVEKLARQSQSKLAGTPNQWMNQTRMANQAKPPLIHTQTWTFLQSLVPPYQDGFASPYGPYGGVFIHM